MNNLLTFARPTLRRAALRRAPPTLRAPYSRLAPLTQPLRLPTSQILRLASAFQQCRGVASSVSGRPGSQTVEQAALNVREEMGNSTTDWAKSIAGGNFRTDSVVPTQHTFLGITSAVAHSVPMPYIVTGLVGGIPYIAASAATMYLSYEAGLATAGAITNIDPGVALTVLDRALNIQVTYGAVMLSFLGALHWGMEFAGLGGHKGYARLLLGAAPVLYAWPTLALDPTLALIAQWVGFTGLWWADLKATTAGWTPAWYSQYRFYLSILVGTCIITTLASISYWGPVAGHGLLTHDLELIRSQRAQVRPSDHGSVPGNVEAVNAGTNADTYVIIRKKHGEEEHKQESESDKLKTAKMSNMPYSTANWHWKNKTVTPWAKAWFERELVQIEVQAADGAVVRVDRVVEVDGDVEVGRRKSKLITIYDCKVVLNWKGTAADGTEVDGRLIVPEVSHEITLDGLSDYVYEWSLTSEASPSASAVLALAKSKLPAALEEKFAAFPVALVDTHGKDIIVGSSEPSRTGSPAPTPAASTSAPAPSSAPAKKVKVQTVNAALVEVEATFQASADDLFSLLTDEKRIPMWSRAPAKSEAKPETEYALFGGGVRGKYISLDPPKAIKQTWSLQSPTWPEGHEAILTTTLAQATDSTKVTFSLDGVPTGMEDEIRRNIEGY
ncbi:hypothetical protein EW146_g4433 [Bondarzewia mesenterica]|uniref:Activator of Hsp90 ATPase AHSA1-like N-terminal domain-containing protein n=1 Tax=Bondarzewia mesenterica TaxID=1095465 RepID=A0A4S4LUI0_9AGAM|nr:hypothetical protein EW146_g4433 [Bondarzewia mesenterica]